MFAVMASCWTPAAEAALLLVGMLDSLPSVGPGQVLAICQQRRPAGGRLTEVLSASREQPHHHHRHAINCRAPSPIYGPPPA